MFEGHDALRQVALLSVITDVDILGQSVPDEHDGHVDAVDDTERYLMQHLVRIDRPHVVIVEGIDAKPHTPAFVSLVYSGST